MQGWCGCRRVFLVGRRGPVQAACTAKEVREILGVLLLKSHPLQYFTAFLPCSFFFSHWFVCVISGSILLLRCLSWAGFSMFCPSHFTCFPFIYCYVWTFPLMFQRFIQGFKGFSSLTCYPSEQVCESKVRLVQIPPTSPSSIWVITAWEEQSKTKLLLTINVWVDSAINKEHALWYISSKFSKFPSFWMQFAFESFPGSAGHHIVDLPSTLSIRDSSWTRSLKAKEKICTGLWLMTVFCAAYSSVVLVLLLGIMWLQGYKDWE